MTRRIHKQKSRLLRPQSPYLGYARRYQGSKTVKQKRPFLGFSIQFHISVEVLPLIVQEQLLMGTVLSLWAGLGSKGCSMIPGHITAEQPGDYSLDKSRSNQRSPEFITI